MRINEFATLYPSDHTCLRSMFGCMFTCANAAMKLRGMDHYKKALARTQLEINLVAIGSNPADRRAP